MVQTNRNQSGSESFIGDAATDGGAAAFGGPGLHERKGSGEEFEPKVT
jgi:hypothetical protein